MHMNQIYNSDSVHELLDQLKGKKIVFTNGCFDLLHPGHIDYLTKAKALGDALIVGLNSDQSVQSIKGPARPINNQQFRSSMLLGLKPIDAVIIFEEDTPINLISTIKPSIHVKGGDYNAKELAEYQTVLENGGDVKILSFLDGYSTTGILNKIKNLTE